ncbi:hypothetical protein F2P81_016413 [Scophthalmus maximus]|uniref:KHA domain-containing protein n=1 Tax=Scophthalmus maximus TaxID=52904 RepID=A0A6A4SI15_SCOMX|nr:hypothetical protein F2P81_016413 [Scophthalmus maximus]
MVEEKENESGAEAKRETNIQHVAGGRGESSRSTMRRVTVFVRGGSGGGKVVSVCGSMEQLLTAAGDKLRVRASGVYNGNGGLIDDVTLIRDDDVLYVSEEESRDAPQDDLRAPDPQTHTDWLTLNVGGRCFTTTRSTLVSKEPESMLAHMFREKGVLEEARFFGIEQLAERLETLIKSSQPPDDHSPLTRKEFIRFLLATTTKSELRCQGLNFNSADLSRLDLRYINFKMANLRGANLTHANLSGANLERADLSMASLDGVDMEGSQMTGINLRVATLKNAKLKNCNLRGATLAGTDLENCDLSGCDLQEANLRGSNVKGAIFEEMLTPLHMSQSVR